MSTTDVAVAQAATAGVPVVSGLPSKFQLRDVLIPVICVLAVAGLFFYLHTASLSPIERSTITTNKIVHETLLHTLYSLLIAAIVLVIAIALGVMVTRPNLRWTAPGVIALANAGQSMPNVGLIAMFSLWGLFGGTGLRLVVFTLSLAAILPVLRNTIVGIQQVDPGVIDAARGVGMSNFDILRRVELVLAIPVIAAGARTAIVLAVATVPFGDYVGAGGLGDLIIQGIKLNRVPVLFTGALMVAVLALLLDWLGSMAERVLTPRGMH